MNIDWRKVREILPGAKFVAWDKDGTCSAYNKPIKQNCGGFWECVGGDTSFNIDYAHLDWMFGKCPGQWSEVMIEYPGDSATDIGYVALVELSVSLHQQSDDGKAAAKRAKAVDRVIAAADEFLKEHAKALDAAGIDVLFRDKAGDK